MAIYNDFTGPGVVFLAAARVECASARWLMLYSDCCFYDLFQCYASCCSPWQGSDVSVMLSYVLHLLRLRVPTLHSTARDNAHARQRTIANKSTKPGAWNKQCRACLYQLDHPREIPHDLVATPGGCRLQSNTLQDKSQHAFCAGECRHK